MEVMESIRTRRSIRRYADRKIPDEDLRRIAEAGILAPSSKGIFPAEVILVTDKEVLAKLAEVKAGGGAHVRNAAAAAVVIADTRKADAWVEDCSLVMGNMMLAAQETGIGSCWIQIRLRKAADGRDASELVRALLSIPEYYETEAILALGYPDEAKEAKEADLSKLHTEKF